MPRLSFDYSMVIEYEKMISRCNFTIKCIPKSTSRQTVENINIELFPENNYCEGMDGLGNLQIYGVNKEPHDKFIFRITGQVISGLCEYEEIADDNTSMIFKHPYGKTVMGDTIRKYCERLEEELEILGQDRDNKITIAEKIMHRLSGDMQYMPNTTNVNTTAEEAFMQGCGVCQDYAHIYIAILRYFGIPARYVTGLIVGEGASHGWVEALIDNKWYGFDPTNDKRVLDEHIKIGVGRDAGDCKINRGIMHGEGLQTQTISVSVDKQEL